MGPEYGATCAIFPVDHQTLEYLRFTARDDQQIRLVEAYTRAQGLFHTPDSPDAEYSDLLELDLRTVEPAIAGPKRPHDRINLNKAGEAFRSALPTLRKSQDPGIKTKSVSSVLNDSQFELKDGAVVIAAITSCTNTSNPSVMIGAGLLAKKAVEKGLQSQPWVKTSLAPGSQVVTEYLNESGLDEYLNLLGFNTVGYGCTTCIGNSGPLPEPISKAIRENDLVACSVLSGNRNFEGRISPDVRANYLASPPLVVAYALAGRMDIDLYSEALGTDHDGREVFLKDIWPTQEEINSTVSRSVKREMFETKYADVFSGPPEWQALPVPEGELYQWDDNSTYIRKPTFFEGISPEPQPLQDITGMKVLALLGDSVTTDHISPAGSFPADEPAGRYLIENGVSPKDFNSFGSRRGNHEVMVRGTFANIRLRNLLVPGIEGGFTKIPTTDSPVSIFEASTHYQSQGIPLIVLAGKEYGTGSSRDWAAKGTRLLGIHAVIAESFERIHRSNLIGMGVLPLQFKEGENVSTLGLTGEEVYNIAGLTTGLKPGCFLKVTAESKDGSSKQFEVLARVDTPNEVEYYRNGGILHYVLRSLRKK
jgi:aconitate hydratase